MTPDECLSAAWTHCAPNRLQLTTAPFARGFWPDVARVAMAMFVQQTATPELNFEPTSCKHGIAPTAVVKNKTGIDLSKMEINL